MMRPALALLTVLLLPVSACGAANTDPQTPSAKAMRANSWQEAISAADRKRLAGLWSAWTRSLNQAADAGHTSDIAGLGDMAVPDAARAAPAPAPGAYRCRSVRLGSRDTSHDAAQAVPSTAAKPAMDMDDTMPCTITAKGSLLWLEQADGAQRIGGTLYPDGDRMVFLGTKALKGEMGLRAYGSDAARDQVGVLRAFGDHRWRLELPWPHWQANLEIIEIIPA